MLKHVLQDNLITDETCLTDIFYSGCTQKERVGVELEKLPVSKTTFKAAPYKDVARFLTAYKNHENLEGAYENGALLGLRGNDGTVSLEPGSQTEISLRPVEKISEVKALLDNYNKTTRELADENGICWLGYGIQPVSTYKNMQIIPKKRYEYMTRYLPTVAKKPLVMMRETAGIQASFDYKDEQDAMDKLRFALKLSPIVSAAFANSPVRNGRLTKYKSYRASSWLETDNERCGLVSSRVFKDGFSFEDYAQILLDVPMIFIERLVQGAKTAVRVENLTFRQFIKNGYGGFYAETQDWELHLSLYFPDVRLKSYVEIRNHDNQRSPLICAVPAFWKGLIYNKDAMDEVSSLVKDFSYFDFEYLRQKTPVTGTDIKIKHRNLKDIVKEIVDISYQSLCFANEGEEVFLAPFKELTDKGITPADVLIDKWKNEWRGDVAKLVEYSRL